MLSSQSFSIPNILAIFNFLSFFSILAIQAIFSNLVDSLLTHFIFICTHRSSFVIFSYVVMLILVLTLTQIDIFTYFLLHFIFVFLLVFVWIRCYSLLTLFCYLIMKTVLVFIRHLSYQCRVRIKISLFT